MTANFPAELAVHLAGSIRSARRCYRQRLTCCQKKVSAKTVHDLRVETRRILALLDLLEILGFGSGLKKMRKTFKKRLDSFDDLRDTQVQLCLLKPLWRRFPAAKDFKKLLRDCEECLVEKLARKIRDTKQGGLNRRLKETEQCLRDCAAGQSRETSAALALLATRASFDRAARLRRQVRRGNPKTIHRLRVAFKRFRYGCELLQPFLPGLTAERLEKMKDYQRRAGDVQDVEVLLARFAAAIKDGQVKPAAVKGLRSEWVRRRRHAIDSFRQAMDELFEFEPGGAVKARMRAG